MFSLGLCPFRAIRGVPCGVMPLSKFKADVKDDVNHLGHAGLACLLPDCLFFASQDRFDMIQE